MIYFVSIKAKESTGKISRLLFCCIRSANGGISLKPVIGLIPLYDDDKESLWMLPGYMRAVETCGGLPVMLPLTNDEADLSQAYRLSLCIWRASKGKLRPDMPGQRSNGGVFTGQVSAGS